MGNYNPKPCIGLNLNKHSEDAKNKYFLESDLGNLVSVMRQLQPISNRTRLVLRRIPNSKIVYKLINYSSEHHDFSSSSALSLIW